MKKAFVLFFMAILTALLISCGGEPQCVKCGGRVYDDCWICGSPICEDCLDSGVQDILSNWVDYDYVVQWAAENGYKIVKR